MQRIESTISFVCPQCRADLRSEPDAYRCEQCDRSYPVVCGIPDFRLFPDPYISIGDDRRKGQALAQAAEQLTYPQLVERYWQMTPGVPSQLVRGYVQTAKTNRERGADTWKLIQLNGSMGQRDRLLEVGCGTAGFLAAAAGEFRQAIGLDIAFRWLVVARKRMEELGLRNVRFVCTCAEHMPFREEAFDLVVAEDVLDHTRSPQAFVSECARVLDASNGALYLSVPNRYSLGPDPHVWVWGVGFLPPSLRDPYVRWRIGGTYGPIRPVSYFEVRRLLRNAWLKPSRLLFPSLGGEASQFSRWQRFQARCYELLRNLPPFRPVLCLVGPWFKLLCRRQQNAGTLRP
jgi:SAM-dependent methyltransferase